MTWKSLTGNGGSWSGIDWTTRAGGTASADPYLAWAEATRFADLGGLPADGWVRVIIELNASAPNGAALTAQSFALDFVDKTPAWNASIRVSSVYRFPPAGLEGTHFLTAAVTKQFFQQLDSTFKPFVKRFELGMPVVPDDLPVAASTGELATGGGPEFTVSKVPAAGPNSTPPQCVFLGVMDDGLAFAHERFRSTGDPSTGKPSTTRIECFWNQDDAPGTPPGLNYGRELTKETIDAMLAQCTRGGLVDEDAVYAQAGYIHVRKHWAHGTEVMDLAGGVRPNPLHAAFLEKPQIDQRNALLQVQLIGVQFRTAGRRVRDTSGRWFAVHALDAMRYVLHRAESLAQGKTYCVVLNLSYGYMAGPHDGSSMIEQAIDELILLHRDLSVVVPAGNSNVLRCHAKVPLTQGASQAITWRALPDCATPGFLEIWLPEHADASKVSVQINPPSGDTSPAISVNGLYTWRRDDAALCTAVFLDRVATGQRNMILIALAPTITHQQTRHAAPAGNWRVTVSSSAVTSGSLDIHAWVQRNETAYSFPLRGRQSRFDDPHYRRFVGGMHVCDFDEGNPDSWICRSGTLNSIATGNSTVVIGAYRRTDGTAAAYSSTGPSLRQDVRDGPDATAVSEDSPACEGVLGASTRSGSLAAISGTSAAAPQVARLLACAKVLGTAIGISPLAFPPYTTRNWIANRAAAADPPSLLMTAHQLGTCPGTAKPPVEPLGTHAWVPRLVESRGGSGRFPSTRWRKRGVKL